MTPLTTFSAESSFSGLCDEFVKLTTRIGWCSVATVDSRGRPRTRILHVSWETSAERAVGWVGTSRTPVKTAHLAGNPYLSCSYWTSDHDAIFVDCRAAWVSGAADRRHAWDMVSARALERGFDPAGIWPGGPDDPGFEVLRLDPWRIQVTVADLAQGRTIGSSRVWHAAG